MLLSRSRGTFPIGIAAVVAFLVIAAAAPREAAASHLAAIQTLSLRKTDFLLPRLWAWLQSDGDGGEEGREVRQLDQPTGRKLR